MEKRKTQLYPVLVECLEEGGFYAECPLLQGCHVEGATYSEAMENLEDAIRIFIESYRELGKPVPETTTVDADVVVSATLPIPIAA